MNVLQFENIEDRHLGRALALQAAQQPEATFIMFGATRYSFADANRKVNELAAGLADLGLGRGDRVVSNRR